MSTTTDITDAIDDLDPEHGNYLYDVYPSGRVYLSYCPDYQRTAIPLGGVDPDEGLAKLDADDEADRLERLLAGLGLTIDRRDQPTYDAGESPGVVQLILSHAHGELDEETLEAHAVGLDQALGEYLYATDADERPEGALSLKERLDDILVERRRQKEDAQRNRYTTGLA